MGWFDSVKSPKLKKSKKVASQTPHGLWKKCPSCNEILQVERLIKEFQVCPYCTYHFRLGAVERIKLIFDEGSFISHSEGLSTCDPLKFEDKKSYQSRLEASYIKTGTKDGTHVGVGEIKQRKYSVAIMDFGFMGGSMGVVTGEKITRAMERGLEENIPVLVVSCSGGARMQEGILSLMQMAKISGLRSRLRKAKIPYISLLTDPTTGGCAASFSFQGDIHLAEPGALIGFAGPRVIEQSIRQTLPDGFQRSEFLLEHGFIDSIVHRHKLRENLAFYGQFLSLEK